MNTNFHSLGRSVSSSQDVVMRTNRDMNGLEWETSGTDSLSGVFRAGLLFLRRHYLLLILGALIGIILAPMALKLAPPVYRAQATILFDSDKVRVFQGPQVIGESNIGSGAAIDTQIQIMLSKKVLNNVIERLELDKHPKFQIGDKGKIEEVFGRPVAEFLGRVRNITPDKRKSHRIDVLRSGLKVARVPGTFTIVVQYSSDIPEHTALIANTVANAYLESQIEEKRRLSKAAEDWLRTRLEEVRKQVAEPRRKAIEFRNKLSLVGIDSERNISRQITDLNSQALKLNARASEARAKLNQIAAVIKDFRARGPKALIPEILNNPIVTKLRGEFLETSNRKAEWSSRYGRRHRATLKLGKRMSTINAVLFEEYKRVAESYRSEIAIARQHQDSIQKEIAKKSEELQRVQKAHIKLRELESSAEAYQKLYKSFLARQSEIPNQDTLPVSRMRILNEASTPIGRSYKKTMKSAILIILAGLGLGFGVAVTRDMTDRSFRRVDDVEWTLKNRLLSVVPYINKRELRRSYKGHGKVIQSEGSQIIRHSPSIIWAAHYAPESQYASTIRAIRLRLKQTIRSVDCNLVGVTSVQPGEGSSTIAASLALSIANTGASVLLLDCDLRNSSLTRDLAPSAEQGLNDVLVDKVKLQDALWHDPQTGLRFLPATLKPGMYADEILGSHAMKKLIKRAKKEFDHIIFDLPPMVPTVDVQMMHDLVDAYIGVIKWGVTNKETVRLALALEPEMDRKLAGIVLNQVDLSRICLYDTETAQLFDRKQHTKYLT